MCLGRYANTQRAQFERLVEEMETAAEDGGGVRIVFAGVEAPGLLRGRGVSGFLVGWMSQEVGREGKDVECSDEVCRKREMLKSCGKS